VSPSSLRVKVSRVTVVELHAIPTEPKRAIKKSRKRKKRRKKKRIPVEKNCTEPPKRKEW